MAIDRAELIQQAQRELDIPTPRPLRLRPFGKAPKLWAMIAFGAVFFVLFFSLMSYQTFTPILAHQYGTPAQAKVLQRWQTHGKGASNDIQVYYAIGSLYETGKISISLAAYGQVAVGQMVNIHYLSLFPGRPSLDASPPSYFTGIFYLVIIFFAIRSFIQARKKRALMVLGKAVNGRVTGKNRKTAEIQFEFEGKIHILNMPVNYYSGNNELEDPVVVLMDPEQPTNSFVYDPQNILWIPAESQF